MKNLRLLLWPDCNRSCSGCCNKDWNLDALPRATVEEIKNTNLVMLTGGEPMLYPEGLKGAIENVRALSSAKIYIYTAKVDEPIAREALIMADGMTLTLHCQSDVEPFLKFAKSVRGLSRSLRLNVFKGIEVPEVPVGWVVKNNIEWIENCPLPTNEIFRRY